MLPNLKLQQTNINGDRRRIFITRIFSRRLNTVSVRESRKFPGVKYRGYIHTYWVHSTGKIKCSTIRLHPLAQWNKSKIIYCSLEDQWNQNSQGEEFFQFQMAAHCGGHHFVSMSANSSDKKLSIQMLKLI